MRAASGLIGVERRTGRSVRVRDFSVKAVAIESSECIIANEAIEIELQHHDQTFVIQGVTVRSDRVAKGDSETWLTAIAVRWNSPQARAQFEAFLWSIPRSPRQD
jgi:hypothetical protein